MKLKDMITSLRHTVHLAIRNKENYDLCEMDSNSAAIKYFADKKVSEWFPTTFGLGGISGFVVYLEEDGEAATEES